MLNIWISPCAKYTYWEDVYVILPFIWPILFDLFDDMAPDVDPVRYQAASSHEADYMKWE